MKNINYIIATFFYCGYFPFAPGTFASLVAGLLGYFILLEANYLTLVAVFFIITIAGFLTSGIIENYENKEDPSIVVIDEASGILVSMLIVGFFYENYFLNFILSFVFFRFYDITKFFPVNKMEKIKGGSGIMLDDIVAGIMAGVSVLIIVFIAGKIK
ncbi:phosphatidylglycerophosphatase A [Thermotomaculum hydrothermale]|uniref:Phosphatidylglycerophosphatase A n=1 Tax=Thermotomaculum hydrothermale TaxID=981385 RepID=A0A7R6PMK3_9BACT|nr:phosphatidylglycerophosphatase A [Thermotomaculum hydrothermale]BBB31866.1 phosphatidylglycerophosphatase A [Thermotomaculum hydrothermale]